MTVCNQLAPNSRNGDAIGRSFPDVLTAAQCSDSEHGPIARPPLAGVTSRTRKPHFPWRQVAQPHNPRVCGRPACVFFDSSQRNILRGVAPTGQFDRLWAASCYSYYPIPLHFAHGSMPGSVLRLGIISTVARRNGKDPFHSIRRSQWNCWVVGIAVLRARVTHHAHRARHAKTGRGSRGARFCVRPFAMTSPSFARETWHVRLQRNRETSPIWNTP